MSAPLLEVHDLRVEIPLSRGTVRAVDGVSFALGQGNALGLVGESGCGKSMTLRAILGLLPRPARITGGQVLYDGVDLVTASAGRLRDVRGAGISMVFQEPMTALNPVMRVGDQIAEGPQHHLGNSRRSAQAEAVELMRTVGIPDAARRARAYPHELSGGMLQRVMIAAALLTEPQLLLADEPTTALDVTTQAEVMAILDDLRREYGLAILFITHDLDLAAAICDRTAVMYAGQIVEIRESALMHSDPLHPYSAALGAARPDIASTAHRLAAIGGRPLSAFEAPDAECAFAPRCPHAAPVCRAELPSLVELDGGLSRCARAAELRGRLSAGLTSGGETGE